MTYLKRFLLTIFTTVLILIIIHYNNLDIKFQFLFFNLETKLWLVNRDDMLLKFFFYKLPKYLIITYGVCLIFWLCKLRIDEKNILLQKKILFLILALILTPLIVAALKHYSPIYCPNFIQEFGGSKIYISPFKLFSKDIFFNNYGKCFPAGHASGGFALLSLCFVMPSRFLKIFSFTCVMMFGWIMGIYQIAKGAHYLSDTIVTLSISYLICLILSKYLLFDSNKQNNP